MEVLLQIVIHAPLAIADGKFDVSDRKAVYGLPARLIGILLLQIPGLPLLALMYVWTRGGDDRADWLGWLFGASFFVGAIGAAVLCSACAEPKRTELEDGRTGEVDSEDGPIFRTRRKSK
jgi:hypothetical protein